MLWFLWLMLFVCLTLILLLLMRMSIMRSHLHQVNTFISQAVTLQEMEQYFAKLVAKTTAIVPLPSAP